jgi:hypothetical protein
MRIFRAHNIDHTYHQNQYTRTNYARHRPHVHEYKLEYRDDTMAEGQWRIIDMFDTIQEIFAAMLKGFCGGEMRASVITARGWETIRTLTEFTKETCNA